MTGRRSHRNAVRLALAAGLTTSCALISPAQAQRDAVAAPDLVTLTRAAATGLQVAAIRYERLDRTHPVVVERELLVAVGRPLNLGELDESVQRLNNLGVFRIVTARLEAAARNRVALVLRFDEKWTLLPIVIAGRGGGVEHLTVGAMETHLLGRYLETGAYYRYFNGSHSGAVWLVDPRLLHRRIVGRVDVGVSNRTRTLYDEQGAAEAVWGLRRLFLATDVQVDIKPRWLRVGAGLVWGSDHYDEAVLTPAQRQLNVDRQVVLPIDRRDVYLRTHLRLGRIDRTDYFHHGQAVKATADLAPSWLGSEQPFARATVAAAGHLRLGSTGNLGARVVLGAINEAVPERMFYVGGLGWKRGFVEGRYRGLRVWNANLEARISSLHHRLAALQHVFFCDVGAVAGDWSGLADASATPPFSVGTGVRLVLPLVARFLARLDVAMAFGERRDWRISFGSQQFF